MALDFKDLYSSFDAETRHIYHVLALSPTAISVSEIFSVVSFQFKTTSKRLREVLDDGKNAGFIRSDYRDSYLLEGELVIWLYPLIEGMEKEKQMMGTRNRMYSYYYGYSNSTLISYLEALWYKSKNLKTCEDELLRSPYLIEKMMAIFSQPRYEAIYNRISPKIIEPVFREKTKQALRRLDSLEVLIASTTKMLSVINRSLTLTIEQAQLTYRSGNWQQAKNTVRVIDCHVAYFAEASIHFVEGDHANALAFFEKGLRKQRRDYKQTYIPVIPEAAMFYLVALFSGERENYIPAIERITDPKTKFHNSTDSIFVKLCHYFTSNSTEVYSGWFKTFLDHETME